MTRDEAIYTLEQMKTWSKDFSDDEIEAINYAMKCVFKANRETEGDLISRQAVLETLDWYEHDKCEIDSYIREIADDVKKLPTAKENLVVDWIPVTERLPDEMGMYLVTLDYQEKGKGVVSLWFHNDEIGWNRGWNENVTAWMPLPKPYKEGEEA